MNQKIMLVAARMVSWVLCPAYFLLLALVLVFRFSYLNILTPEHRYLMVLQVAFFTFILPCSSIVFYRRLRGWHPLALQPRRRRVLPYLISIGYYLCCLLLMRRFVVLTWVSGIIMGAVATQVACLLLNLRCKVCIHSAGAGGAFGTLLAYSLRFGFYAPWWLLALLLMGGVVGSARIVLGQHTLHEVLLGYGTGLLCCFVGIMI